MRHFVFVVAISTVIGFLAGMASASRPLSLQGSRSRPERRNSIATTTTGAPELTTTISSPRGGSSSAADLHKLLLRTFATIEPASTIV